MFISYTFFIFLVSNISYLNVKPRFVQFRQTNPYLKHSKKLLIHIACTIYVCRTWSVELRLNDSFNAFNQWLNSFGVNFYVIQKQHGDLRTLLWSILFMLWNAVLLQYCKKCVLLNMSCIMKRENVHLIIHLRQWSVMLNPSTEVLAKEEWDNDQQINNKKKLLLYFVHVLYW